VCHARNVPAQVVIDRASAVPLYAQIADQLRNQISAGALRPGERIENEEALAARLRLSRPTVARAINQLVGSGLLVRRRGFGTEVSASVRHGRTELTSLYEDLQRNSRSPSTRVLVIDRASRQPQAAAQLGLPADAPLLYLRRLRLAAQTPVAVMDNWLPGHFADLTEAELTADGLYGVLRRRGRGPTSARQRIGAKAANLAEAGLLQVRRGAPLMTMESIGFDADEVAVECGTHVYRADIYAIDVLVRS
jgi:DNA-binding GntR family transcriptional regulator